MSKLDRDIQEILEKVQKGKSHKKAPSKKVETEKREMETEKKERPLSKTKLRGTEGERPERLKGWYSSSDEKIITRARELLDHLSSAEISSISAIHENIYSKPKKSPGFGVTSHPTRMAGGNPIPFRIVEMKVDLERALKKRTPDPDEIWRCYIPLWRATRE